MARVEAAGRRRHAGCVSAALLAALVVTGCGVRNDYAATERTTSGSVNVDSGPIALRHLRVVLEDGQRVGVVSPVLRGSVINSGDRADVLLRVTSPAAETVQLSGLDTRLSRSVPLAAGSVVRLERPTDPGWVLEGAGPELLAGTSVPVTFHFAHQGRLTVTVPVTAE